MEQAALLRLQGRLDEQVKQHFPDGGVQQVTLLQHGDDPQVEPGGLWVRVAIKVPDAPSDPDGPGNRERALAAWHAWQQAHEPMLSELQREFAQALPNARMLEFILDDTSEPKPGIRRRIGGSLSDLAERQRGLTPVMARLGPLDLWTLDMLITAGIAANRAEALRWVLARTRERPGYAKLTERARELDQLKAEF
jgi:hypothetical protein